MDGGFGLKSMDAGKDHRTGRLASFLDQESKRIFNDRGEPVYHDLTIERKRIRQLRIAECALRIEIPPSPPLEKGGEGGFYLYGGG